MTNGHDLYYADRLTPQHIFFFSSRGRHAMFDCDWSSDVCSSDLRNAHRHCRAAIAEPMRPKPAMPMRISCSSRSEWDHWNGVRPPANSLQSIVSLWQGGLTPHS